MLSKTIFPFFLLAGCMLNQPIEQITAPDKIEFKSPPSVTQEAHPKVFKQEFTFKDEQSTIASITELMKQIQQELKTQGDKKKRPYTLGIATPIDVGGNLRPTKTSNWVMQQLQQQANQVGLQVLGVHQKKSDNEEQLDSLTSGLDVLFERPELLYSPSNWKAINPRLKEEFDTKIDAMLLTRTRLDKSRQAVLLEYTLVDLRSDPPIPLLVDSISIAFNETLQAGGDVFLVIDNSGSMGWNDPENYRIEAANYLIEELAALTAKNPNIDFSIGTLLFNHETLQFSVLKPISLRQEGAIDMLNASISQLVPYGGTDLDDPFEYIYSHVSQNRLERPLTVIFFTDGEHTDGPLQRSWLKLHKYTQSGISTISGDTIALGAEPRFDVLQDIRYALGGNTGFRRISVENKTEIYDAFFRSVAVTAQLAQTERTILRKSIDQPSQPMTHVISPGNAKGIQISITPSKPRLNKDIEGVGP